MPNHYITLAGALFGAVIGYLLMLEYARFQVKSAWWQRLACYLLGIVGLLVIYFGLDVLFGMIAEDASLPGYLLRYLRYGAVSFWAMFGAPWVFIKLGLADLLGKPEKPALAMPQPVS